MVAVSLASGLVLLAARNAGRWHAGRFFSVALLQLTILLLAGACFAAPEVDAKVPEEAAKPQAAGEDEKPDGADDKKPAPQPGLGFTIRIDLPINGNIDTKVREAVSRILGTLPRGGARPILIVELWPGQTDGGGGSDFYRALSLAKFLSSQELAGVKTVAYVPKTIRGHAVLVALACEEIVMAKDAEIGEAGSDEQVLSPTVRSAYREIAEARRTVPVAVALAMLDGAVQVYKVQTEVGTEYLLADELEELKKTGRRVVQNVEELKPRPLVFDGRAGRAMNFVSYLADDRAELARALNLPLDAVQDNPALAGGWRPLQFQLSTVAGSEVNFIQQKINRHIEKNDGNLIIVRIDSDGGELIDAARLAVFLAGLDGSKVRTVAYIPERAAGESALVAMACDQIVIGPRAVLGGPGKTEIDPAKAANAVTTYREAIAADKHRGWSIAAAMIDPQLKVHRFTQPTTGLVGYFCEAELAEQADPKSWVKGEQITSGDGPLELTGERAENIGVAWKTVDNYAQFKQAFGLERDPTLVEPGWADKLIELLSSDSARITLLIAGLLGLYIELNTPGIGAGSFIALVAFLLFFWAEYMQGNAAELEILLFLLGVLCLAIELFVLPGVGVFGLGGGLLVIISLILASQTFVIPANEYELNQLRNSMLVIGGSVVGFIGLVAMLRRFLPHAPMFNRMLLAPPSSAELEALSQRETLIDLNHLLGADGVATTRLMPSGKARFGDETVDVIADGEAIDRGTPVTVVEVRGNRLLVQTTREETT